MAHAETGTGEGTMFIYKLGLHPDMSLDLLDPGAMDVSADTAMPRSRERDTAYIRTIS